jgi:hypothetical protein
LAAASVKAVQVVGPVASCISDAKLAGGVPLKAPAVGINKAKFATFGDLLHRIIEILRYQKFLQFQRRSWVFTSGGVMDELFKKRFVKSLGQKKAIPEGCKKVNGAVDKHENKCV